MNISWTVIERIHFYCTLLYICQAKVLEMINYCQLHCFILNQIIAEIFKLMKFSNHTWILEATPSFFCSTIKDGCYLVIKMWVLKSKPRIPQAHHSSRQYKEALEPACVFAVFCRIHEWGKGGNDDCLSIFVPISLALLLHRKSL